MSPPSPQAVHVHLLADDPVREPALPAACEAVLSAAERERLERLRLERVRREYLASRALVRTVLSRYAPVAPADWVFGAGPHGRPEIAAPAGAPPLRFNLSHTTGMLAVAVTLERDVGMDVEHTGRDVSDERLARRFFAPREAADVVARQGEARRERFFAYWTLKEAYIKARGLGLAMPLGRFWLELEPGPVRIRFAPGVEDDPADWQLVRLVPGPRHAGAVVVRRGAGADLEVVVEHVSSVGSLFRP